MGKIPFDEKFPSLEPLEQICRTLFSFDSKINNSIDLSPRSLQNFNIENVQTSKYFQKTIEQFSIFIKLSQHQSQLIRDCLNSIINGNDNLEYDLQLKQQINSSDRINSMALSNYKDSPIYSIGYPREISFNQIIDQKTKEIQKIQFNYNQQGLLFSDDSKYLISVDNNSCLHIYKNEDLKFIEESRIYFAQQSILMSYNNEQILLLLRNFKKFVSILCYSQTYNSYRNHKIIIKKLLIIRIQNVLMYSYGCHYKFLILHLYEVKKK